MILDKTIAGDLYCNEVIEKIQGGLGEDYELVIDEGIENSSYCTLWSVMEERADDFTIADLSDNLRSLLKEK